jgi:hypothetical protein
MRMWNVMEDRSALDWNLEGTNLEMEEGKRGGE